MPGKNGLEMIASLQGKTQAKFIILSGYQDFDYVREALRLGAADYVLKPVQAPELKRTLERVLAVQPQEEEDDHRRYGEIVARVLSLVAEEFSDKTVLLLGCGDSYVQLAARHRDHLPANVIAPYIEESLLNTLINKEKFYQLCDEHHIDHPSTFIYDKSMGELETPVPVKYHEDLVSYFEIQKN